MTKRSLRYFLSPSHNCFTDGDSLTDAVTMGEDALALVLWDLEVNQKPIPAPSDPAEISAPEDTGIAYITTDTAPVHRLNESRSIRKNVTILLWLDTLAREHNINFSNFLQNALMKELHVAASHT